MKYKRKLIIITVILVVFAMIFFYDYKKYHEVTELIVIDEINMMTRSYGQSMAGATSINGAVIKIDLEEIEVSDSEELFVIDASENKTLVKVNGENYIVDDEVLFKILSKYKCIRSRNDYSPFRGDEILVDISLVQNLEPKHIVLGYINIWYSSGDEGSYDIIDGNQLLDEIIELVSSQESI